VCQCVSDTPAQLWDRQLLAPARSAERLPLSQNRALLARINRQLAAAAKEPEALPGAISSAVTPLARHYLLDLRSNRVLEANLDLREPGPQRRLLRT